MNVLLECFLNLKDKIWDKISKTLNKLQINFKSPEKFILLSNQIHHKIKLIIKLNS